MKRFTKDEQRRLDIVKGYIDKNNLVEALKNWPSTLNIFDYYNKFYGVVMKTFNLNDNTLGDRLFRLILLGIQIPDYAKFKQKFIEDGNLLRGIYGDGIVMQLNYAGNIAKELHKYKAEKETERMDEIRKIRDRHPTEYRNNFNTALNGDDISRVLSNLYSGDARDYDDIRYVDVVLRQFNITDMKFGKEVTNFIVNAMTKDSNDAQSIDKKYNELRKTYNDEKKEFNILYKARVCIDVHNNKQKRKDIATVIFKEYSGDIQIFNNSKYVQIVCEQFNITNAPYSIIIEYGKIITEFIVNGLLIYSKNKEWIDNTCKMLCNKYFINPFFNRLIAAYVYILKKNKMIADISAVLPSTVLREYHFGTNSPEYPICVDIVIEQFGITNYEFAKYITVLLINAFIIPFGIGILNDIYDNLYKKYREDVDVCKSIDAIYKYLKNKMYFNTLTRKTISFKEYCENKSI